MQREAARASTRSQTFAASSTSTSSALACCTRFHRASARVGGSIVVLGSTSTYIATPGQPGYGASKGALLTLVKSFAHAWAHESVRVNGIAPGFVETKLTHRTSSDPKRFEASLDRISLRRWGRAEEMGDAGLFLASPTTSYITGQMLRVDGGITLMS